jgi:hypothetical protein
MVAVENSNQAKENLVAIILAEEMLHQRNQATVHRIKNQTRHGQKQLATGQERITTLTAFNQVIVK